MERTKFYLTHALITSMLLSNISVAAINGRVSTRRSSISNTYFRKAAKDNNVIPGASDLKTPNDIEKIPDDPKQKPEENPETEAPKENEKGKEDNQNPPHNNTGNDDNQQSPKTGETENEQNPKTGETGNKQEGNNSTATAENWKQFGNKTIDECLKDPKCNENIENYRKELKLTDEEIKKAYANLHEIEMVALEVLEDKNKAVKECRDLYDDLNKIYKLSTASAISGGVGTAASGTAFVSSLVKQNKAAQITTIAGLATSTATSGVSAGTSIAASVKTEKLEDKMKACRNSLSKLKTSHSKFLTEFNALSELKQIDEKANTLGSKTLYGKWKAMDKNIQDIFTKCENVKNKSNNDIEKLANIIRGNNIASSVTSSVGTATALAGTITSAVSMTKGGNKKLDLSTKILSGVTAGTSASTTATSSVAAFKTQKYIKEIGDCVGKLN